MINKIKYELFRQRHVREIFLLYLIVLSLFFFLVYTSLAVFEKESSVSNVAIVKGGNLSVNITSTDDSYNTDTGEITVPAGETKSFTLTVSNNTAIQIKYKLYYQMLNPTTLPEGSTIGFYGDDIGILDKVGEVNYSTTIGVKIANHSEQDFNVKILFELGYGYNELVLSDNSKYELTNLLPTKTFGGNNILALTKSEGVNLENYKIYGNSVQNGNPTPDTPSEIESVGNYDETTGKYIIPVTISGNLIRHTTLPATSPFSVSYNENINSYSIQGTLDTNKQVNLLPSSTSIGELKAGESLTFAIKRVNGTNTGILRITAGFVDSDGKIEWSNFAQLGSSNNEDVRTFTVTKNVSIKYLRFYGFSGDFDLEVQTQILKGSYTIDTLPSYEPYKEPITTNIYLNEPLRKVGEYFDELDFKNQKVVRKIKEVTFNGSETWYNSDNSLTNTFRTSTKQSDVITGVSGVPLLCDKLNPITAGTSSNDTENIQFSSTNLYVRILRSRLSEVSLTGAKEWIADNNLKVAYPLATPIEEPIELPTISTYEGTNVIEIDTTILPSDMEVTYYVKA